MTGIRPRGALVRPQGAGVCPSNARLRRRPAAVAALVRVLLGCAAVLGAGWGASLASPAQAAQAGYPGYCRDAAGVTVVVDFGAIGGGTVVRCAQISSGTGLDALRAAGLTYEGVRRWGDAFVCRIAGRPSAQEELPVQGREGYREQCVDTPPASAFWSYWYAPDGGSWVNSPRGLKSREVIPGGFEGWSFSLNASAGSPAPGVRPARPAAPLPTSVPSPTTAPRRPPSTAGVPTPVRPAPDEPGAPALPGSTSTGGASGRSAGTVPGPDPSGTAASTTPRSDGGRSPAASAATAPAAADGTSVAAAGGIPASAVVGAGLLAFLLTLGAGTAWSRRRQR